MKNRNLRNAALVMALILFSGTLTMASAQGIRGQGIRGQGMRGGGRGQGMHMAGRPAEQLKLTDDQKQKMTDLRTQFQDENLKQKNLIREKEAHLKTLIDTDNRDAKDLDKTIADLTGLRGEQIKKGITHRDEVKKILTPDQMRIWDQMARMRLQGGERGRQQMGPGRMGRGPGMRDQGPGMRGGRPGMRGHESGTQSAGKPESDK